MRDFDNFTNIIDKIVTREEFTTVAKKALFSVDTTPDEISLILSRYEVCDLFDINLLNDLINNLYEQHKLIALVDAIVSLVPNIFEQIQDSINGLIIELVISDCGGKRLLGRKLFDTLKPSVEDMRILSLDEDSQVRFVVSLTQDYGEAEHRGRHLCHVFNSDSAAVRAYLVKVIIDYTLNYFGFFKTIIEEGHFNESDELNLYKKLLSTFSERFDLANQCVEFSSENFFPDIFEIVRRSEQEFIQEQLRKYESTHKSYMLELFKPLALGRGGGFRREGRVTPLAKISSSMLAPMMLASKTPLEQREYSQMLLKDWEINKSKNE
ncbi:hypothetical protein [Odoribacter lunatus]|uniref:hypothetical protein n=1 Tax=Odoribacter lunatus TaxID=2941335 RepID=UPI00203BF3C4|nr:hypothetical protein [Odoribacter lunatus]